MERQIASHGILLVAYLLDGCAVEGNQRELLRVQKIGALDIFISLRKPGVQSVSFDFKLNRRFVRSCRISRHCACKPCCETTINVASPEMTNLEKHERVNRIDLECFGGNG